MRKAFSLFIVLVLLPATIAFGAWQLAQTEGHNRLRQTLASELELTARALDSEIERYRYLPSVLAEDRRVLDIISNGEGSSFTSSYLRKIRDLSGADQLFVLDHEGTTLAASNATESVSFVGQNYRFRPYFADAMTSGTGRFYAVGVTTGKPGYFLSSRIETANGRKGVAVVKIDMEPLQNVWRDAGVGTAIADQFGVVFLSGNPDWLYRPLTALSSEALEAIEANRTYTGINLAGRVPLLGSPLEQDGTAVHITDGLQSLIVSRSLIYNDWQLLNSGPMTSVTGTSGLIAALTGLLVLLVSVGGLFWLQRRQLVRMKLDQHEQLERRVEERTEALAREIDERRRAESDLRSAQDTMLQQARLAALGRMSAAIVHEISQPLSAMDNTLAAARKSAENDGYSDSAGRVEKARALTRRMQRTVKHLRTFSRRGPVDVGPISPLTALQAAVEIAQARAKQIGAKITILNTDKPIPEVSGEPVRLEQVCLNLIINALDAVAHVDNRDVVIDIREANGHVEIEVSDQGVGIPGDVLSKIYEPFFTTKETGEGLGLGLSISRAIVEEFGGTLELASNPDRGTTSLIRLPALSSSTQSTMEAAQ